MPGHVSVRELSVTNCEADKEACRERQLALAELAGRDIVLRPTGM